MTMKMYTGTNEFDGKEVEPFIYINPYNKNEWSNKPYPVLSGKERRRLRRKQERDKRS